VRHVLRRWEDDELRHGICGAPVCQVCGRFGSFRGWAAARACHRGGEFVGDVTHAHPRDPVGARHCKLCAARAPGLDLCEECLLFLAREAPGRPADEVMRRVVRWRHWRLERHPWPRWATDLD
jgi:hypothetical protein